MVAREILSIRFVTFYKVPMHSVIIEA